MEKYIVFCSGGNDSIALIQNCFDRGLENVTVAYNETGWAHPLWPERMKRVEMLVRSMGYQYETIKSKGFEQMVRDKRGFPMAASKMSFCTQELKTKPTLQWLRENDPRKELICVAGVRREESENRKHHLEYLCMTSLYEGRVRWFPIVEMKETETFDLIKRAGFKPLPHSSLECFPCINSNRKDLRLLATMPDKIKEIDILEISMGFTGTGKPRVMFRPRNYMGATGIKEVVKWALCDHGKYKRKSL